MNRNRLNFIVDAVGFVSFILLGFSGYLMKYVVECGGGYRGGRGLLDDPDTFLWLTKHGWSDLHFVFAIIMIAMFLVHLILHWNWIMCQIRSFKRKPQSENMEQ